MKKLFILILLLASCSAPVVQENGDSVVERKKDGFRRIIPQTNWERIFFEAINEQAGKSQLPDIRSKALPDGDLEVRIWIGFGLGYLQGFVLNQTSGEWSATYLTAHKQAQKKLQTPRSGWETTWLKLVNAGLLSLPDAEEINCSVNGLDGEDYVVEYNTNNTYRTYLYDNPHYPQCNEAKQMIEIRNIIAEEFDILGKRNLVGPK
jgi:hypothetical protein